MSPQAVPSLSVAALVVADALSHLGTVVDGVTVLIIFGAISFISAISYRFIRRARQRDMTEIVQRVLKEAPVLADLKANQASMQSDMGQMGQKLDGLADQLNDARQVQERQYNESRSQMGILSGKVEGVHTSQRRIDGRLDRLESRGFPR